MPFLDWKTIPFIHVYFLYFSDDFLRNECGYKIKINF